MIERERGPIKVEIVKHFGVLSTAPTGWTKEFNLVRWNDRPEKYDIRDWAPGHERMSKGVTLFDYEMKKIADLCAGLFEETQNDNIPVESALVEQEATADTTQGAVTELIIADKAVEEEVPF